MFICPRVPEMDRIVERMRDARQRLRLGLPVADDLEALLDSAAEVIEEAQTAVQCLWAAEMQIGVSMRSPGESEGKKLEARLRELRDTECMSAEQPKGSP